VAFLYRLGNCFVSTTTDFEPRVKLRRCRLVAILRTTTLYKSASFIFLYNYRYVLPNVMGLVLSLSSNFPLHFRAIKIVILIQCRLHERDSLERPIFFEKVWKRTDFCRIYIVVPYRIVLVFFTVEYYHFVEPTLSSLFRISICIALPSISYTSPIFKTPSKPGRTAYSPHLNQREFP
jgi:hypothetical protein